MGAAISQQWQLKANKNRTPNSTVRFNSYLPMDIIIDILSRLPIKPLLRFKSVCKTWYELIQNHNFIQIHQKMSRQDLMVLSTEFCDIKRTYSMWLRSSGETRNLLNNPNFLFKDCPNIVGICDGLVCATLGEFDAIIFNPTIGKIRNIPPFSSPHTKLDIVFMGFVLRDKDYKLFRIVFSSSREKPIHGDVYTMSSDRWSEIEVKCPKICTLAYTMFLRVNPFMPVAINEVIYWGQDLHYNLSRVAYFDTNSYDFGVIDFPGGQIGATGQLVTLKGKLALMIRNKDKRFDLWVLNEKESSWTMKLRTEDIPFGSWGLRSLGCERNGKLVIQHYSPARKFVMFLYDMETRERLYLHFDELKLYYHHYLYRASLIW